MHDDGCHGVVEVSLLIVYRLWRHWGTSYASQRHMIHISLTESAVTACSFYTDWAGIKFYQVHKKFNVLPVYEEYNTSRRLVHFYTWIKRKKKKGGKKSTTQGWHSAQPRAGSEASWVAAGSETSQRSAGDPSGGRCGRAMLLPLSPCFKRGGNRRDSAPGHGGQRCSVQYMAAGSQSVMEFSYSRLFDAKYSVLFCSVP